MQLPPLPEEDQFYKKFFYLFPFIVLFIFTYFLKDLYLFIPDLKKMTYSQKTYLKNTTPSLLKRPDFSLVFSQDYKELFITNNYVYSSTFNLCLKSEKTLDEVIFNQCFESKNSYRFLIFQLDHKVPEGFYDIELKVLEKESSYLKKIFGFDEEFYVQKKVFIGESKELFEKKLLEKKTEIKIQEKKPEEERFLTFKSLLEKLKENLFLILESKQELKKFKTHYEKNYAPLLTQLLIDLSQEDKKHFLIPLIEKLAFNTMKFYHEIKDNKKNKISLKKELEVFFNTIEKELE